jgi:o-succinylbenzoate synthase
MNNLELTYTPYVTQLKKPFQTSGVTINSREGFILILKSGSKSVGIGEAAPLPEFGSETFEEVEKALASFNLKLNIDLGNIEETFELNLKEYDKLPSLKCGLELAILKLICSEKSTSIPALLNRNYPESIFVNGVIGLVNTVEASNIAIDLIKKGFKTLKIKVGRNDFEEDLRTVKNINDTAGDEVKLRIDANAKWNKDEALEYLIKLEPFGIQYAEQPVKDLDDFIFLKDKIKIPLAADESVRNIDDAEKVVLNKAAGYIILKPMMIGGIIPTLKIGDFARDNGIQTVVTSSFEGLIGRISAVNAAAFINNDLAHGLATADYFDEENIPDPYPVSNGKILFQE